MFKPIMLSCCLLLTACAGGDGKPSAELAAKACDTATRERLEGKDYQLDVAALAKSMQDKPDGSQFLSTPIVVEPGLATEAKQVIECSVRFSKGKDEPDVIGFVFNW